MSKQIRTIEEINEKIKNGQAVVVTADELIDLVEKEGIEKVAKKVDVVTTGTFGPMCSSGAILNVGHTRPRIKIQKAWLNGINAYAGLAAVDVYLGATEMPDDDPENKVFPGEFKYGGGHVIQDLVDGKDIKLEAVSYGTDCYPRKKLSTLINLKDMNEAFLFNPRNAYQNYNVAVNTSDKTIYTYLGVLRPHLGNANYCSAGQLSPLLKDPFYKTIGIGTRIFLGGGIGYVVWNGTQYNPGVPRSENGVPKRPAGTISVVGDLKQMNSKYLKGVSFLGYGASLNVGIGVPIPILDEDILKWAAIKDAEILAPIVDYSDTYPNLKSDVIGEVSYAELKSGKIKVQNKEVPTAGLSSYPKAVEIANELKDWIKKGEFTLGKPIENLPGPESGIKFKPLNERPIKNGGK
ncbi:MAG: homocysteine biosynthesis protein [Candidatus Margulisiibacteriota bacterium]